MTGQRLRFRSPLSSLVRWPMKTNQADFARSSYFASFAKSPSRIKQAVQLRCPVHKLWSARDPSGLACFSKRRTKNKKSGTYKVKNPVTVAVSTKEKHIGRG